MLTAMHASRIGAFWYMNTGACVNVSIGPEGRHDAIDGSVCGYCRQHNVSKRSVQIDGITFDIRRRHFNMKCRRIHVAEVASDASSARFSKFKTLNPCEAMLTIRMLFASRPKLTK